MQLIYTAAIGLLLGLSAALPTFEKRADNAPTSASHHLFRREVDWTKEESCEGDPAKYLFTATKKFSMSSPLKGSSKKFEGFANGVMAFLKEYNPGIKIGQVAHCRMVVGKIEVVPAVAPSTKEKWSWEDTNLYEIRHQRDNKEVAELNFNQWHVRGVNRNYKRKFGGIADPEWTHERIYNEAMKLKIAKPGYFKFTRIPLFPGAGQVITKVVKQEIKNDVQNCESFYVALADILKTPPRMPYTIEHRPTRHFSDASLDMYAPPSESEEEAHRASSEAKGSSQGASQRSGGDVSST